MRRQRDETALPRRAETRLVKNLLLAESETPSLPPIFLSIGAIAQRPLASHRQGVAERALSSHRRFRFVIAAIEVCR